MDGEDIPGSKSFYSVEYGAISHKKISSLCRSKLKSSPPFVVRVDDSTMRAMTFCKESLDSIGLSYDVPSKIEFVTDVTDVTDYSDNTGGNNVKNEDKTEHVERENNDKNTSNDPNIPNR